MSICEHLTDESLQVRRAFVALSSRFRRAFVALSSRPLQGWMAATASSRRALFRGGRLRSPTKSYGAMAASQVVVEGCPQLRYLNVNRCWNLTDHALRK
eukprot:7925462-Pyramimonas_sp.AAC.1